MDANCAPLVANLFSFCEQDFLLSLSGDNEPNNSTSRYLNDQLYIDNNYSDGMISQINPSELQLNKANSPVSGFTFDCFRLFCFFYIL